MPAPTKPTWRPGDLCPRHGRNLWNADTRCCECIADGLIGVDSEWRYGPVREMDPYLDMDDQRHRKALSGTREETRWAERFGKQDRDIEGRR